MDLRLGIILLCLLLLTVGFFSDAQQIGQVDNERRIKNVARTQSREREQLVGRSDEKDLENDRYAALPPDTGGDLKRIQIQIVKQVNSIKMFAQGLVDLMDFRVDAWNSTVLKLHTATRLVINTTQDTATNETYVAAFLKINLEDVLKRVEPEEEDIVPEELYQHQLAVEVDVFRQLAFRAIDGTTRRIANRRNAIKVIFDQKN